MKTLQPSEPQSSVALLLGGGCLVTGFRGPLGSAAKELTSPPGGPVLGLTVDSSGNLKPMGLSWLHLLRELFGSTLDIFLRPYF